MKQPKLALSHLRAILPNSRVAKAGSAASPSKTLHMLERVIEEGFDGIVILDKTDQIVRLNGNARRLLSISQATLDGEPMERWLPRVMVEEVRAVRRSADRHATEIRETEIEDIPGDVRYLEFTVTPIDIGKGIPDNHLCLTLRDITDRRRAAEHIRNMAMRDSLTGVLNRRGLWQAFGDRHPEQPADRALIYLDLDRFKSVNDGFGHGVGDELLVQVAQRTNRLLKTRGLLARLGGDEFAVLFFGSGEEALFQAQSLLRDLARPFSLFGTQLSVGTSIGVATSEDADLAALMQRADVALYDAKSRGGRRVSVYHPVLEQDRRERLALERELAESLNRGEMQLVYQPQVVAASGDLVGVEALMRWKHPKRGFVPPSLFIPIAEETGFIHQLTEWLINTASTEAANWPSPITVAVNVSSLDLQSGKVPQIVQNALAKSGLSPDRLELEITETAFVRGGQAVDDAFHRVRALGVEFALDDFGTGYSSLSYLHRYPFAKLKIDRSFVTGIPRDEQAMAILRSIVMLAQGLGLRTIAEGVETHEQRETLQRLGCEYAQGYLFSKPITNASLTRLLMVDGLCSPELGHRFNAAG